jgi:asparagine synthase (glutamine-hydrolysing)
MSGIAAVLRFDSRPVEPDMIGRMTEAIAYRGPDGIAHWTGEGAALGHCMFRTTAESLEEAQPLADETGRFHLVMDGWLANPDELRTELEARGVRLRGRSDAELVLRAWQTWREACCDHIDGEFARYTGTGTANGCSWPATSTVFWLPETSRRGSIRSWSQSISSSGFAAPTKRSGKA